MRMNDNSTSEISLLPYNTFGINVKARQLVVLQHLRDFEPFMSTESIPRILGGGSNILCTADIKETILLNRIKGIQVEKEDEHHVWISVSSGEIWHDFVLWALDQGLSGIENLALIPGTVGAAPIQNIGAYGVEVKDTIEWVDFWNWPLQQWQRFSNEQCHFGYRESIFKQILQKQYFIASVCFRLNKHAHINTGYGAIRTELEQMGISAPDPRDVAEAVIRIRRSKLPDPVQIGNAGSFFKNLGIPLARYQLLSREFPEMPSYPVSPEWVKIPAAWLIEQCGWKGFREGDYGVHAQQALVLVNYGNAKGQELWELSDRIVGTVRRRFGIELEREVQVW